jgi:hypothetical protein
MERLLHAKQKLIRSGHKIKRSVTLNIPSPVPNLNEIGSVFSEQKYVDIYTGKRR